MVLRIFFDIFVFQKKFVFQIILPILGIWHICFIQEEEFLTKKYQKKNV